MKSNKALNQNMQRLADAAVVFARDNFGMTLDASEDSIRQVEEILNALHASIAAGQGGANSPTEQQVHSVALMMGAYIGEIIRKKWNCPWYMKQLYKKEEIHAMQIGGQETFPVNKAYKRLTNGREDNVFEYFQVLQSLVSL